jgi:hypothetical protein
MIFFWIRDLKDPYFFNLNYFIISLNKETHFTFNYLKCLPFFTEKITFMFKRFDKQTLLFLIL